MEPFLDLPSEVCVMVYRALFASVHVTVEWQKRAKHRQIDMSSLGLPSDIQDIIFERVVPSISWSRLGLPFRLTRHTIYQESVHFDVDIGKIFQGDKTMEMTLFGEKDVFESITCNTVSKEYAWRNFAILVGQDRLVMKAGSFMGIEFRVFKLLAK